MGTTSNAPCGQARLCGQSAVTAADCGMMQWAKVMYLSSLTGLSNPDITSLKTGTCFDNEQRSLWPGQAVW
ncbi:hypothetical protein RRG08_064564 [Elysia crispata]|uniref:Uncharacterized protein n=1 Tax=Elysia crispata TaxID=231223 RepID=A0AAE1B9T5_9GAST|nr:hypothetical protein RRG08_064564 [Elysia crispata]